VSTTPEGTSGWHPDPSGEPQERYWDGERWTSETRPYPAPGDSRRATQLNATTPEPHGPSSSVRGKTIALVGLVVVLLAAGVGGVVAWRQSIDQAARDAAAQGAQIGGPPMSEVQDLLCPDGPNTNTTGTGIDCSGIGAATPSPTPSDLPSAPKSNAVASQGQDEPDSSYLQRIADYCDSAGCESDCSAWTKYKKGEPGADIFMLTVADARVKSMVLFGAIEESEASAFKPKLLNFWGSYCE